MKKYFIVMPFIFSISACSALPSWLGDSEKPPLPGERVEILPSEPKMKPDASLADDSVNLPDQRPNTDWAQAFDDGGNENVALAGTLQEQSSYDAGTGPDDTALLLSQPIIASGAVYTIDGENTVTAFKAGDPSEKLWQVEIETPEDKESVPAGGMAYADGKLFITTGFGHVVAISAKDGSELWRRKLNTPMRTGPKVMGKRLYVTTIDNQLFALSAEDGKSLWKHSGISETTTVFGGTTPALRNNLLVIAYSSGEVFGLSPESGTELWSELLTLGGRRTASTGSLNDIDAAPVIADDMAYVVSHSGTMAAFNLKNGFRVWEQKIAALQTPWIGGDYLFLVTTANQAVAVNRHDGRVRWVTQLEEYTEPEDKKGYVHWAGPVMAGNRLLYVGSHGKLVVVRPDSGKLETQVEVPEGIYTPPVVANGFVYLMSNAAELVTLK